MVGGDILWLGRNGRFHIVGGAWIYIGEQTLHSEKWGCFPTFNIGDIYISIHEISPPVGDDRGGADARR